MFTYYKDFIYFHSEGTDEVNLFPYNSIVSSCVKSRHPIPLGRFADKPFSERFKCLSLLRLSKPGPILPLRPMLTKLSSSRLTSSKIGSGNSLSRDTILFLLLLGTLSNDTSPLMMFKLRRLISYEKLKLISPIKWFSKKCKATTCE